MPLHFARAYERRLQNEKNQPTRKDRGVHIEDPRPRHGRMDKILVYGEAEAIHDHCNKQKRHAKIEIVIQSSARPNRQGSRAGLTHGLLLSCDHRNCTQYYHGNIVLSEMRRFASGTRQSAQSGNFGYGFYRHHLSSTNFSDLLVNQDSLCPTAYRASPRFESPH